MIIEGSEVAKCTLIAPLCHLNCLWMNQYVLQGVNQNTALLATAAAIAVAAGVLFRNRHSFTQFGHSFVYSFGHSVVYSFGHSKVHSSGQIHYVSHGQS